MACEDCPPSETQPPNRLLTIRCISIAVFILLTCAGRAQPVCFVQMGADTTICQGGTAVLHGPPGFSNHLWSTGATTPNISVNAAGNYWCQISYPTGNLVFNGDFSAGNTGFTSQYIYSTSSVQNEGYYAVGTNSNNYHPQFQGTGTGNFLIANGGFVSWANNQFDLWCQTIPCCPGQTYTLTFDARTLTNALPGRLMWTMDGVSAQWPDFTLPAYNAGWQPFTTTWTAGPGQTSVNACLYVTSGDGVGDDFGIDNIAISSTVVLRDTVQVNVTPLPVVDLGPNLTLCAGDVLNLDATVAGGSYLWQNGSTAPTHTVTNAGHYSVVVTALNCSNSDAVNISYNPLPIVDLGNDTLLCAGSTLVLNAFSPGYSYLWQNGSTASSFTVNQAGTYWVEVERNNCTARDTIQVGYLPMPTVFLGPDTTICAGATVVLDATVANATYLWENGSTAPVRSVSAAGTFSVAVDLNGCVALDAIQVAVNPLPTVDLGPDQTLCPGAAATLDATTAGATYLWSNGSTAPTLSTSVPGSYHAIVTVGGCAGSDTVSLANFTLQAVDLGPDRSMCAGSTLRLGVHVPGATYLWNTGATTDSITVTAGGTYWVSTVLNGCTVSDTVQVNMVPLPVATLGPDRQVCPGNTATLDATTANAAYLWNNGATTPIIEAGVGIWSVQVTANGCSAHDTVAITAYTPPVVDLGPDTLLCPGESLTLAAGAGTAWTWSTGAHTPTIAVSTAGQISVIATDVNGCQGSDQINITYAQPGATNLGPDRNFCAGTTVLLDATTPGASGYQWNNGTTSAQLPTSQGGTYWVEVSIGQCTVGDTIQLTAVALPVVDLGPDTLLCPGETLTLLPASASLSFMWQDGSTASTLIVAATGIYSVEVTNTTGCTAMDTVQVGYHAIMPFNLGADTTVCGGTSVLLDASIPGGTTVWSGASQATTSIIAASTAGSYIATTTVAGCTFSDTLALAVVAVPVVDLGPDVDLCTGSTLVLATNGPNPTWDDGSTSASRQITQGGTFWVTVSVSTCSATDTVIITEFAPPPVQLGPDTGLCPGQTLAVDVTVPGGAYLWNDGITAAQRQLGPGNWSVAVTANTCTATDILLIDALPAPVLSLPMDTTLCAGEVWTPDVGQPNSTYLWSTGSTSSSIAVAEPGTFGITVVRQGCTASAWVNVQVVDLTQFSLGPDTVLCPGASLALDVAVAGASVVWQDGTTVPHYTVTMAGNYQVAIAVAGCTAQSIITVSYSTIPLVDLGPDRHACTGDTVWLAPYIGLAQATWSDATTGSSLAATSSGLFTLQLEQDGCITGDTVSLIFDPVQETLDLGPDQEICFGQSIVLDATTPGAAYLWNDGSTQPALVVERPGMYLATITGPCMLAMDTVHIVEGSCAPFVHIPNAFTPNGDDINDLFMAIASEAVDQWTLTVFDRWGLLVFSAHDPADAWDGTYQGREAPVGVYVWDLHYRKAASTGVVQVRDRGSVTLVR